MMEEKAGLHLQLKRNALYQCRPTAPLFISCKEACALTANSETLLSFRITTHSMKRRRFYWAIYVQELFTLAGNVNAKHPSWTALPIRNAKIYLSTLISKFKLYGVPSIRVLTEETEDVLSIMVNQNVWLWGSVSWYSGFITAELRGSEARQIACPGRQPKGHPGFAIWILSDRF